MSKRSLTLVSFAPWRASQTVKPGIVRPIMPLMSTSIGPLFPASKIAGESPLATAYWRMPASCMAAARAGSSCGIEPLMQPEVRSMFCTQLPSEASAIFSRCACQAGRCGLVIMPMPSFCLPTISSMLPIEKPEPPPSKPPAEPQPASAATRRGKNLLLYGAAFQKVLARTAWSATVLSAANLTVTVSERTEVDALLPLELRPVEPETSTLTNLKNAPRLVAPCADCELLCTSDCVAVRSQTQVSTPSRSVVEMFGPPKA